MQTVAALMTRDDWHTRSVPRQLLWTRFPEGAGCKALAWSANVTGMLAIHSRFYILMSFRLKSPFSRTAGHKIIFLMVCRVVATSPEHPCPFTNYPRIIKIDEKKRGDGKGRRRRVKRVSKCSVVCFSLTNLSPMSRGYSKLIGLDEVRGGKYGTQEVQYFDLCGKAVPTVATLCLFAQLGGMTTFQGLLTGLHSLLPGLSVRELSFVYAGCGLNLTVPWLWDGMGDKN